MFEELEFAAVVDEGTAVADAGVIVVLTSVSINSTRQATFASVVDSAQQFPRPGMVSGSQLHNALTQVVGSPSVHMSSADARQFS